MFCLDSQQLREKQNTCTIRLLFVYYSCTIGTIGVRSLYSGFFVTSWRCEERIDRAFSHRLYFLSRQADGDGEKLDTWQGRRV